MDRDIVKTLEIKVLCKCPYDDGVHTKNKLVPLNQWFSHRGPPVGSKGAPEKKRIINFHYSSSISNIMTDWLVMGFMHFLMSHRCEEKIDLLGKDQIVLRITTSS